METLKIRYESPELEELAVNVFTVIAGATPKEELIQGDVAEEELA